MTFYGCSVYLAGDTHRKTLERLRTMNIVETDHEITRTRTGRTAKPNPFATVIGGFADGKTRTVTASEGEKVSTILVKLRAAAADAANFADGNARSVTIELIGSDDLKTATGFHFNLRAKITRTRKTATDATTEVATEVATPAKTKAKAKA